MREACCLPLIHSPVDAMCRLLVRQMHIKGSIHGIDVCVSTSGNCPTLLPLRLAEPAKVAVPVMLNSDVVWVSSPLMGGAELASSAAQKLHIASGGQLKPSRFCIASVADRMRSPAATNIVADLKRLVADSLATV